jgi:hypothetical protein
LVKSLKSGDFSYLSSQVEPDLVKSLKSGDFSYLSSQEEPDLVHPPAQRHVAFHGK